MPRQPFKPPGEWPAGLVPLVLGLGVSSGLVVAGLGLRWPVLLGALTPPVVAGGLWRRSQRQLTAAAIASGSLLDPWVLQRRLAALLPGPSHDAGRRADWQAIGDTLEAIRHLAASCGELDPASAVPLLLLLEGWLDRIQRVVGALPAGRSAPLASPPSGEGARELAQHLSLCRTHLARLHDDALRFAQRHPDQPVVLPPLPSRVLP